MSELFGRSSTIATMDLPNNLGALFDRLPAWGYSSADGIIERHTLFRYYTAFQPLDRRNSAREAMMGIAGSLHLLLGVAAFRTGRPTHLQFCPACAADAAETHGFLFWRGEHQLPGVLVCATHGHRLRRSSVRLAAMNRHAYVPATPDNCHVDCEPVTQALRGRSLDLAIELSRASSLLLHEDAPSLSMEERRDDYRSRLSRLGLVRGRYKVDQTGLNSCFRDHYGDLLQRIAGVDLGSASETWLNSIVRSSSGAHPPLQHILLKMFLDSRPRESSAPDPRGQCQISSSLEYPATAARAMNWQRIDCEYAAHIRMAARELRALCPPARVTGAAIERRLERRGWLGKRRLKLPRSTKAMREVAEDTDAFRRRRLQWHALHCIAEGIVDPWIVLRRAGLPHGHAELVKTELALLQARPQLLIAA